MVLNSVRSLNYCVFKENKNLNKKFDFKKTYEEYLLAAQANLKQAQIYQQTPYQNYDQQQFYQNSAQYTYNMNQMGIMQSNQQYSQYNQSFEYAQTMDSSKVICKEFNLNV